MTTSSIHDEKALLQQVAAGDQAAFTQLFHRWHQQLGRHIFQIIKSPELTEEIVQDVFVKIWQTRETLTEVRSFPDYLFITTRNQAITALRKLLAEQQRKKEWEKNSGVHASLTTEIIDPVNEAGLSLIDEAISKLPPQQRNCFVLSRQERLTYEQIATRLGIGRETVKTHIELAVAAITRYVKSEMDRMLLLLWIAISITAN